jgi:dihydrofolate reductase
VLTHHPRDPVEMAGGTTFHFVTDGFDAAYARALDAAAGAGVHIAGGASTVRQALVADVVDELTLDLAPVLLASGERLLDGVAAFGLEPVEALHSPLATHVRYRRQGSASPTASPVPPTPPTSAAVTRSTPGSTRSTIPSRRRRSSSGMPS